MIRKQKTEKLRVSALLLCRRVFFVFFLFQLFFSTKVSSQVFTYSEDFITISSGTYIYTTDSIEVKDSPKLEKAKILVAEGGLVYHQENTSSFEVEIIKKEHFAKQKSAQVENEKNVLAKADEEKKEVAKKLTYQVQRKVNNFIEVTI